MSKSGRRPNPLDAEILRLAVPTLAALVAEPLFLIVDTALIGHLGSAPLAGLGIASVILQTAVGLLVFLAYATTPAVARLLGSGDERGAVRAGIDGLWLAAGVGALLLISGLLGASAAVDAFGAREDVTAAATTYLTISLWGLPAMLLVLAATGLMRGLQDTRTPLLIVGVGFAANAVLNAVFIYGFGWGIAGSALGTVVAQWGMALWFVASVVRAARAVGAELRPGFAGVTLAASSGGWLLVRTVSLRAAMLATVLAGSALGVIQLAALNVALAVFSLLAFVLDALAIAGQAMIGHSLGAGDRQRVRLVERRLVRFGLLAGVAIGLIIAALSPVLGFVFTDDAAVREALVPVTLLMAVGVPLAGYVFVLDGVLIGAGDGRYLALAGVIVLLVYLPLLWIGASAGNLLGLWAAFGLGYISARALSLGLRVRGEAWLR
ncbi:MATE family efflux transporter [Glaciihabitans arcticus]|uniref:MATE family efflux transporter n=1 Tax=Glaciihabitans arcticus TaxID=2668039 RepID=A0A4Q9GQP8_9MICO|nr:MATE family efflux transporter [Glaciihabitans arcticus]TBN57202.1 MATE family efflux transporter [Glaciihabitans arcticus]